MVIENEYREKPAEQIEKICSRLFRFAFFQSVELKIIATLKLQREEIEIKADSLSVPRIAGNLWLPLGDISFSYSLSIWYKTRSWEQALLHVFVRASGVVVEVVITLTMKMKMRMMLRWMMTKSRQRVIAWVIRHYLMYVVLKSDGQSNHHLIIIMMMRSKPRENARARGRGPNRRACSQAIKLVTRPTKSPIFS